MRAGGVEDGSWAMVGHRFIGQVVRYARPEGWQAFLSGVLADQQRVPGGPWPTAEGACEALERAWASTAP